jgi:hypothetical protein
MNIEFQKFRDADESVSSLSYVNSNKTWICSDSLGRLYSLKTDSNDWEHADMTEQPVSAVKVSPSGNECAIGSMSSMHIHSYPETSNPELENAGKSCRRIDLSNMHGLNGIILQ